MMSMLNLLWIVPVVAAVAWGFGYKANPERVKAFVKAHIVDEDPYQDEGHSATRYAPEPGESPIAREARKAAEVGTQGDYIDWSKVPGRFGWSFVQPDGCIIASEVEPTLEPCLYGTGWWTEASTNGELIIIDTTIGPLPPWRESLRKRPA